MIETQRLFDIRAECPDGTCNDFRVRSLDLTNARRAAEDYLEEYYHTPMSFDWRGLVVFIQGT